MEQTQNLHTIFVYARQEVERLGNSEVMPDHLMLAILRLGSGKAFELLMQAGLNPVELKQAIDDRLRQDTTAEVKGLSRSAARIVRLMGVEMQAYHAEVCGSAHLLMAMLRERINYPTCSSSSTTALIMSALSASSPNRSPCRRTMACWIPISTGKRR